MPRNILFSFMMAAALNLHAETGQDAWLRYPTLEKDALNDYRGHVPPILIPLRFEGVRHVIIAGADDRGVLYRVLAFLRKVACGKSIRRIDGVQAPSAPVRWINLWDTLGGPMPGAAPGAPLPPDASGSVLWEHGLARRDLSRLDDCAQGQARFRLWINLQMIDEWTADDTLPTRRTEPDGTSSTRRIIHGIALRPGDVVGVQGFPDGSEDAALDYIEILPEAEPD